MPVSERAKQFSAFSALRGLEDAVAEKEFIPSEKIILSEDMADDLDRELRELVIGTEISVTHYAGNGYVISAGKFRGISEITKTLSLCGEEIRMEDILKIEKL